MAQKHGKVSKKPMKGKPAKKPITNKYVKLGNKGTGVNAYNVKSEPFPRVLMTKCRYGKSDTISTLFANSAVAETFRMNSIYDPVYAVGGRTVVGHSVLASIYDQYWVMGAKVSVRFYDVPSDGWIVGVRLRINGNDGVQNEDCTSIVERPLTYLSGLSDTGNQQKTFKFYIKPWSLVGCSKLEYLANSGTYSSAISNNPGAGSTCLIDVFAVNQATTGTVKYEIRIDYYTKLYSRKELTST